MISTLSEENAAMEDILRCSVFYLAMNVPQHKLRHDADSYRRISKSEKAESEEQYKALILSGLLTEAYEMKERYLRGERL